MEIEKLQEILKKFEDGASKADIKHELFDLMSIEPDDYKKLFDNIDDAIFYNGKFWQHNNKSNYSSESFKFDKYVHAECLKALEKLNPSTSVVARKSTRQIVEPHINNTYVLRLDFKKYYESIDYKNIQKQLLNSGIDKDLCEYIKMFYFTDGKSLRRGLRASPILSEYIGLRVDNSIHKILYTNGQKDLPYTRYYDDVLISSSRIEDLRPIESSIIQESAKIGLEINKKKTRIKTMHTTNLLGLRVHNKEILIPKSFKKKLRARIDHLNQFLDNLINSGGWEDPDEVYQAKVKIGGVIGSLWYIINNSSTDTTSYSIHLEHYYIVLAEYSRQLNFLLGDEEIFEREV